MRMTVCKKTSFDAAHYLPDYPGKCANMHGHHWVVELGVEGEVNSDTGMVIDFAFLGDFGKAITTVLDHSLINKTIPTPTAENIASWIRDMFLAWVSKRPDFTHCKLSFVRVWETPDSFAEVSE